MENKNNAFLSKLIELINAALSHVTINYNGPEGTLDVKIVSSAIKQNLIEHPLSFDNSDELEF